MEFFLDLYGITLDFIYKISGPMIAVVIIGLTIYYRGELGSFISNNISKIKGKVGGQEFEIDLNKLKESQSERVVEDKKISMVKDAYQLAKELEFEKIYSIIFGSQIEILKLIRGSEGLVGRIIIQWKLESLKTIYPIYENWSLDEFLNILVKNDLLQINEDEILKITQKGLDFLRYIEENNYNDRLF